MESEQRVELTHPVVEFSEAGGAELGRRYWQQVERSTLGLVRVRSANGVVLRILGRGPALLRLGAAEVRASAGLATCSYAIRGGLLARRAGGEISFAQTSESGLELRASIRNFHPALGVRPGEPHWTGALYSQLESRIHVWISRRFFRRLVAGAPR